MYLPVPFVEGGRTNIETVQDPSPVPGPTGPSPPRSTLHRLCYLSSYPASTFGALVKRLRLEGGLSQERLGELSGLHRNYIGAIERAERTPSIVTADRLARALATTLAAMFAELERLPDGPDDM
ncbi:MAG: helix-turn-helix transcriptional regulator [Rubrobacter sp.]|nr:helix-turn-helix transcriptional regulator [Rubrobacter sp.]